MNRGRAASKRCADSTCTDWRKWIALVLRFPELAAKYERIGDAAGAHVHRAGG